MVILFSGLFVVEIMIIEINLCTLRIQGMGENYLLFSETIANCNHGFVAFGNGRGWIS